MNRQATLGLVFMLMTAITSSPVQTQDEDTSDLESWTSLELRYRFNKPWMFSTEEQLRLKESLSEIDKYFTQVAVRYKAPGGISFDGGYRWIQKNDTEGKIQGYESQLRYHLSTAFGHKLGRFSLDYRVRYQNKEERDAVVAMDPEEHLRFRVRAHYNIPKWKLDPVFSAELFRSLGPADEAQFDKLRLTLGTEWDTWDGGEMGLFYRLERELGVDSPQTTHIIGLRLSHTLMRD